jgi:outer membrane receptor for monomeric catechols
MRNSLIGKTKPSFEAGFHPFRFVRQLLLGGAAVFLEHAASIEAAASNPSDDLGNMTLEELVNVQFTSVSKKETDLFSAPAAIYVITQEDIHRSGMTSIPELLRMVPGLFYRAYVKYYNRDELMDAAGNDTTDDWDAVRGGFWMD